MSSSGGGFYIVARHSSILARVDLKGQIKALQGPFDSQKEAEEVLSEMSDSQKKRFTPSLTVVQYFESSPSIYIRRLSK